MGVPRLDGANEICWYTPQLHRMASGQDPDRHLNPWLSLALAAWESGWDTLLRRRS